MSMSIKSLVYTNSLSQLELVEETINELLPLLSSGDIIIDHGNSNFKDSRRRAERLEKLGIQYIDCGTSGGVYGLERGYCLMVGGTSGAQYLSVHSIFRNSPGLSAAPADPMSNVTSEAEYGWLHCGGPGGTLCQNGSQWCRIWNHAALRLKVLISMADAGSAYTKEGDAEVKPDGESERLSI